MTLRDNCPGCGTEEWDAHADWCRCIPGPPFEERVAPVLALALTGLSGLLLWRVFFC